jgi:CRISPR/Cas system Type II protein with McrA/HNH and RuvC-like nuclease domain
MPSPNCKRCGGALVDSVAPRSGKKLRYCPACHAKARRLARAARPEVAKAHKRVAYARSKGLLVPEPCQICGDPKTEAHHPNYANALQVQWLCRLHHRRLHAALRRAGVTLHRKAAK